MHRQRRNDSGRTLSARTASSRGAFTLIELLFVVAIVALLIGLLIPLVGSVRTNARSETCLSNLRQVGVAYGLYTQDNDDLYPAAMDPIDYVDQDGLTQSSWIWMGRGMRAMLTPYLAEEPTDQRDSVLLCPADRDELLGDPRFERTSYAYSLAFYHSPEQLESMTTPASTTIRPKAPVGQRVGSVAFPGAKILSGEWDIYHEPGVDLSQYSWDEKGWWGARGSRNHLFADGSVRYVKVRDIRFGYDGRHNPNVTLGGIKGWDLD